MNPEESVESLQSQNSQNDGSISTKQRSRNREIPENEQETTAEGWTVTQTDLKDGRKKRNPQQQPRFFEEVDVVSPQMLVLDAEERRQVALAVNSKSTNPPIQLLRNNGGSLCFEHNSLALIAVSFVLLGSLAVLFVQKMCRMLFSGIFCKENPWSFKWRF